MWRIVLYLILINRCGQWGVSPASVNSRWVELSYIRYSFILWWLVKDLWSLIVTMSAFGRFRSEMAVRCFLLSGINISDRYNNYILQTVFIWWYTKWLGTSPLMCQCVNKVFGFRPRGPKTVAEWASVKCGTENPQSTNLNLQPLLCLYSLY